MLERGVVVSNNENGVDVQMQPSASCEGCNVCFMDKSKLQTVHVNQKVSAQPGDFVEIEVSPGFAVKSAFLIFFLPLLMLLAGYFIFQSFHGIPVSNPLYREFLVEQVRWSQPTLGFIITTSTCKNPPLQSRSGSCKC